MIPKWYKNDSHQYDYPALQMPIAHKHINITIHALHSPLLHKAHSNKPQAHSTHSQHNEDDKDMMSKRFQNDIKTIPKWNKYYSPALQMPIAHKHISITIAHKHDVSLCTQHSSTKHTQSNHSKIWGKAKADGTHSQHTHSQHNQDMMSKWYKNDTQTHSLFLCKTKSTLKLVCDPAKYKRCKYDTYDNIQMI